MRIKCQKCGYEWDTSSEMSMVTCPNCEYKTPRTDEIQTPPKKTQKEVSSLTNGFPTKWIGALVAAIVAVAGAAFLYQGGGGESGSGPGYVGVAEGAFASDPSGSGIENIYLVKANENADLETALSAQENKLLGTIEHDGDVVAIPPEASFNIVVSVKASAEDFKSGIPSKENPSKENIRVSLGVTGDVSVQKENVSGAKMTTYKQQLNQTMGTIESLHLNVQTQATNIALEAADNAVISVDQYIS